MDKKRLILPIVVSLLIIALAWIVCVDRLFHRAHLFMIHGILELFVTFLFPAAPIIYGWITRNRPGSILVGAIPIMGFLLLLNFDYFYFLHWNPLMEDGSVNSGSDCGWRIAVKSQKNHLS